MNFYRLRFINTVLFFILGVLIGFMFKENIFKKGVNNYTPIYSFTKSPFQISANINKNISYSTTPTVSNFGEENIMDEDEYILPVDTEKQLLDNSYVQQDVDLEIFVTNPKDFAQKNISGKMQIIIAKKIEKGWRLNFVYTDKSKNLNYIYIDDINNISGEEPDYKIGYFYNVRFYSETGDLKKENKLLSISSTGEKTSWASGVSAIEY